MWFFLLALILGFGLLMMVGVYALVEIPRRRALGPDRAPISLEAAKKKQDGLLRYPRRLEALELQLVDGIEEATQQRVHLELRASEVGAKEGRAELAGRYADDVKLLQQRVASMRRVLGLVWKTRAVLSLRAHLAVTAQSRPALDGFPDPAHLDLDLVGSARIYDAAATDVQAFTAKVARRASELDDVVPEVPSEAEVEEQSRREVALELESVRRLYFELQKRMDALADTFAYLADSCRTRRLVSGMAAADLEPGGEALMEEVAQALAALREMAEVGDQHLADAAVENLAEDIGQLERTGLEARAEAEAALEVAKLLEQFR